MKKILSVNIATVLLLAIFAGVAISSIWPDRKSPTCDELAHHIPPGYVFLTEGDFKMATDSPPLARYMVALPLKLFMKLEMPADKSSWRTPDRSDFGKAFFYKYNNEPHMMLFLARLPVVLAGVICGFLLFLWGKMMYGENCALVSLFLYCFSPNILAHARLATTDMVATCFIFLSVFSFWLFLKRPSFKNVLFTGIALGLAQLSKYTSVLLYVLFPILLAFEFSGFSPEIKKRVVYQLFLIFVISIVVLWAGYGFNSEPILYDAMRAGEKVEFANNFAQKILPFWSEDLSRKLNYFLFNVPFPLGIHLLGILGVLRHGAMGHGCYFLGKWMPYGHPLFFIVAFFIKTPIPAIVLFLSGLFISFKNRLEKNDRIILITMMLFFITASFSKLQLGLRYILPLYPFCFLIAGRSIEYARKKFFKVVVLLLMAWYVSSALWIWPDYLSYFNEFIGGPEKGYKYLRDSNVDWGQDLPALARYMEDNNIDLIKLHYFGTAEPSSYGIKYARMESEEFKRPRRDIYAISVHWLQGVEWGEKYEPTAKAGYSIHIYDLRGEK